MESEPSNDDVIKKISLFGISSHTKLEERGEEKRRKKINKEWRTNVINLIWIFSSSSHLVWSRIYIKWLFHAGRTGEPKRGRQVQPSWQINRITTTTSAPIYPLINSNTHLSHSLTFSRPDSVYWGATWSRQSHQGFSMRRNQQNNNSNTNTWQRRRKYTQTQNNKKIRKRHNPLEKRRTFWWTCINSYK